MLLKALGIQIFLIRSMTSKQVVEPACLYLSNCLNEGKTRCAQYVAKSLFLLGGKRTVISDLANDLYLGRVMHSPVCWWDPCSFLLKSSFPFWKHEVQEVYGFAASWVKGVESRGNFTIFLEGRFVRRNSLYFRKEKILSRHSNVALKWIDTWLFISPLVFLTF